MVVLKPNAGKKKKKLESIRCQVLSYQLSSLMDISSFMATVCDPTSQNQWLFLAWAGDRLDDTVTLQWEWGLSFSRVIGLFLQIIGPDSSCLPEVCM